MKLKDVEMIPGVIVEENDPKNIGRVKCVAVGLFDIETMSVEALPWIYPLMLYGYQGYAKMKNGQKVWIINNKGVYDEYWYVPFFELNENTITAINDNFESDVLLSRPISEESSMQVYYNKTEGLVFVLGDSKIIIDQNGDIYNNAHGMTVKIVSQKVYCGREDMEYQKMVLGDKLNEMLGQLSNNMNQLIVDAGHPYTGHLVPSLQKIKKTIDDFKEPILSNNCYLN